MIYWILAWKIISYLTGLEIILYVEIGFEKYSNYLTGFGLTLSVYNIYWTWTSETLSTRTTSLDGLGLILLNTGIGLINQPSKDVVTKAWRHSWINCFLPAAFRAPSFGNLCMIISPSTLLCFLWSSGYCMSLSHIPITHLECFPIL